MKEYFFLQGKDQIGPFNIEQLADKQLTSETLMWTDGMSNWEKLKNIPELAQSLKPKSIPPPPPIDHSEDKITKTEVVGHLKVTTEKAPNAALESIKPNRKTLTRLIIWCSFHLFAMLMSYSEIKIFNAWGEPETKKFWPFVDYNIHTYTENGQNKTWFNGIFVEYDWTEFAFYVGGAIILYLVLRISKKQ